MCEQVQANRVQFLFSSIANSVLLIGRKTKYCSIILTYGVTGIIFQTI